MILWGVWCRKWPKELHWWTLSARWGFPSVLWCVELHKPQNCWDNPGISHIVYTHTHILIYVLYSRAHMLHIQAFTFSCIYMISYYLHTRVLLCYSFRTSHMWRSHILLYFYTRLRKKNTFITKIFLPQEFIYLKIFKNLYS